MANSFGRLFRIHSFGESHGPALGVVVDGCPSGVPLSDEEIRKDLLRRRPGQAPWVSARQEDEEFEILSGVFDGKTLGTPIAMVVRNKGQRSSDYSAIIQGAHRIGHADDLWAQKFKQVDLRGGGRASGRETVSRVLAGAVAKAFLRTQVQDLDICAFVERVGELSLDAVEFSKASQMSAAQVDQFSGRFPSESKHKKLAELLIQAKEQGQSYGGTAVLVLRSVPSGLGEPVFEKIKALLASTMLSIGATAGVEFGDAFSSVPLEGTAFHESMSSSRYAGVRGGITTGEPLVVRVAFKPTSSVLDVAKKGRHDPCILPRAVVVMEAMASLVLADMVLAKRLNNC